MTTEGRYSVSTFASASADGPPDTNQSRSNNAIARLIQNRPSIRTAAAPAALSSECEECGRSRNGYFAFDTAEQALEFWERTNGPLIALRSLVPPETYRAMVEQAAHLLTDMNRADDGRLLLDSEYLQVVARKRGSGEDETL